MLYVEEVKVIDIALKLEVDFDQQILDGSATLTVQRVRKGAQQLVSR